MGTQCQSQDGGEGAAREMPGCSISRGAHPQGATLGHPSSGARPASTPWERTSQFRWKALDQWPGLDAGLPIYTAALGKSYGSHEPGFPHLKRSMVPTVACHGLLCVSEKTCQSFYENTGDVRNGRHGNCRPLFAIDRSVAAMCPAGCFHFKLSCPRSSL